MDFLVTLGAVYGAILAASLASFACVVAERAARHEPFVGGRSHCVCGRQLRAYENVPVLGWVRVWGKARCCGARIPAKYVVAEALCAAVGAAFGGQMVQWLQGGVPWYAVAVSAVGCAFGLMWGVFSATSPTPEPRV